MADQATIDVGVQTQGGETWSGETPPLPSVTVATPARPTLPQHVKALHRHRELLRMWSLREIKVRYKQSFLGAAWAILQPLAMMIMFTVVFSFLARIPTGGIPYPIFSYTALLPWTFFATAITFGVPSLVNNMNLVTKIYFPREILPLGAIVAACLDFAVASVVFAGLMIFYRVPLRPTVLWVPVLLAVQISLTIGIACWGSALNVWYRDIRFVVPLALQLWMFASPVIYPVDLVPLRLRTLYMLNPMAALIDSYRQVLLLGQPPQYLFLGIAALVSFLVLLGGYAYFKRSEALFADVI